MPRSTKGRILFILSLGLTIPWLNGCVLSVSLHRPSESGNLEEVAHLIEEGADVNVANDFGETPLQLAVGGGKWLVVNFLRKHGGQE